MTTEQARLIFNTVIAGEPNAEEVAKLEVAREFFTNPDFRKKLEEFTWEQNNPKAKQTTIGG